MPADAPLPGQFDTDPRVHFDKTAGKFQYEDDETGQEFEWNGTAWIALVDEAEWKAQQSAYSVPGVDETVGPTLKYAHETPSNAVLAREERRNNKRKKAEGKAGPSTKPPPPSAPKRTGVWVTHLPPNATPEVMSSVFSKAGVLMIGDDGQPRIKMYYDDDGKFKGEALVMYFKEGSVDLAVRLLDDTELEMGAGYGNMRVEEAKYDPSKEQEKPKEEERKQYTAEDKQRMTKRIKTMQNKITWHSDDESDEEGAAGLTAPAPGMNRYNRVVVLKGMFTPDDLEKDPSMIIDLKEDVWEEAETMGEVTSVTLFDKEEDGVMTVKFKNPDAAQACVVKMNGRFFDGRKIFAGIYHGKERYKKSGGRTFGEDEQEEKERLDKFAQWLVDGDGEEE